VIDLSDKCHNSPGHQPALWDAHWACWKDNMPTQDRIEINPKVMLGKPVIGGTRITVELILRKLGEGASHSELLEAYPNLTENDVQAAIFFGVQAS
jgi:uncharacterized protein (DUF433 family)